ncbi:YggT family protein [soil metagenome]
MDFISGVLCQVLGLFMIVLIVRVIFSWIPRPPEPLIPVATVATSATEWAVAPLRRVIPPLRTGAVALDLSFLVLFFGVSILRSLVCR